MSGDEFSLSTRSVGSIKEVRMCLQDFLLISTKGKCKGKLGVTRRSDSESGKPCDNTISLHITTSQTVLHQCYWCTCSLQNMPEEHITHLTSVPGLLLKQQLRATDDLLLSLDVCSLNILILHCIWQNQEPHPPQHQFQNLLPSITGTTLSWFRWYLSDILQFISININCKSTPACLPRCAPGIDVRSAPVIPLYA